MDMDVFKTLKPNEPGTKRLTRIYGNTLVAVRYRKGVNPNNIYTTVEIIVDTKPYIPGVTHKAPKKNMKKVWLNITYIEDDLRKTVKKAGAEWDSTMKAWSLEYYKACELGLKNRIIKKKNVHN